MTYYDILLKELQVEHNVPLWKIVNRMDEEKQKELVKYINDNLSVPYRIGREVCLLYACWWRYKYTGGKGGHNYDKIIEDYGILNPDDGNTDALFRDIVKNELTKLRQLNIPLYQGESGNNMYLDSVLAQGGIPKAFLRTGNNNFLNYLVSLKNYYRQCDYNSINWHDNGIARQKSRYLPKSFRNEAFYKICLSIVRSIIYDTDEFSDYQDIKEIIDNIKEQNSSGFSSAFRITWSIEIKATTAHLCYSLHIPLKIKAGDSNHNAPTRRYYLDEYFVAEYRLIGDHYVLMSNIPVENKKAYMNDSALFLQYTGEGTVSHDGGLFLPPQLDEPILLQVGDGNHWIIEPGHGEPFMGCLIPADWKSLSESMDLQNITINGIEFNWCSIDWNEVQTLDFEKDAMRISLNNQIVVDNYEVVLNLPQYDWIVRASSLIIPKTEGGVQIDLFDGRKIYVKDENEQRVHKSRWSIKYKGFGMSEFEDYTAARIPCGKVIFSIELPNDQHKRFSAFVVNEMVYRHQNNIITFSAGNDIVTTLRNENYEVTKNGDNYSYDTKDAKKKAIYLLLSSHGLDIQLDIEIPTTSSVFVGLDDIALPNYYHIALSEIDYYRVFLVGSKLRLNYVHNGANGDETIASAYVNISPGCFHSLSYAREVIEKLLLLYPPDRTTEIRITADQQTIIVGHHSYNTFFHREEAGQGIQILTNNKPADGLKIAAVTLPDSDILEDINLIPAGEGKYLIPDDFASTQMIAFSRNASQGISPVRIDPNETIPDYGNIDSENEHRQRRNQLKKESISNCHALLANNDENEWNSVWYYWNIVHDNQLPYTTFNCFLAMASNPSLLAKFCTSIHLHSNITNWGESVIVWELERMEYELGFAFHYIPRNTWETIRQDISDEYYLLPVTIQHVLGFEDYLNDSLKYVIAVFNNQFEEAGMDYLNMLIYNILYGATLTDEKLGWSDFKHYFDEGIPNTYLSNNTSAHRFSNRINIPYCRGFNNISLVPPTINKRNQNSDDFFMQYHCIIMPQVATKNAFEIDPGFWQYNEQSNIQRRLINYIRRYAKKVYNDIFITAFNEKMKNKKYQTL